MQKIIILLSFLLLSIFLPQTVFALPQACVADRGKDGTLQLNDFGAFALIYKKSGIDCAFDIVNNDCYLNVQDFAEFAKLYKVPNACAVTPPPPTNTSSTGIWISKDEIRRQPTSGAQWQSVYSVASGSLGTPDVSNQDSDHDVTTLAAAIVCVRTGEFCTKAQDAVVSAIGTEGNTRWLAVGRNMVGYTIAADLLDLKSDGNTTSNGSRVQTWLASFLTRELPNNNSGVPEKMIPFVSGSNAAAQEGAVYAAIASYLNDTARLEYVWNRFRLYSCDKSNNPETVIDLGTGVSSGWTHDSNNPCAINPKGTSKVADGATRRLDGAIINDMRRGGDFGWPPGYTSYPWVGLEGYLPAALIFYRKGYPAFEISNKAVARTFEYLWYLKQDTGNVSWFDGSRADETVHIANMYYGTTYPVQSSIGGGRTVGFTGYTHPTRESLLK